MDERPPMERAMSTDVVMDIVLTHLKVGDLLNCRKVSKSWNKTASSVLRRRSTMMLSISQEKDLMELEECLEQSPDFPFPGLQFNKPWRLNFPRAKEFFKDYGPRFTSLYLGTSMKTTIQDLAQFVNQLPRLSTLEMFWADDAPQPAELLDSAAGQEGGQILNLPSLRTLRISSELREDVLRQVFTAASSSKLQIEVLTATYGNLIALNSAGKLQAVSVLDIEEIEYQKDYALQVDELLSTISPMLTKLDFSAGGCVSRNGLIKLLVSSEHTLKYLSLGNICPSQFSSECPVLTKLTALSLYIFDRSHEYVFKGRHGHKFPALSELNLCTTDDERDHVIANISDGLFVVPGLTTIDLDGFFNKDEIEGLAGSFPNVIEIRLNYGRDRLGDPSDIWSVGAFKFLEKLTIWDYPVKTLISNDYMTMDRFLTGMCSAVCKNLRKHPQQNLIDSPFNEILRKSPSILQLKNLKQLIICVKLEPGSKEFPEEPPFISMVSLWYALDMVPNLEARFVYKHHLPSWYFEEKDRETDVTMLKTAFKHVQPYVNLEPFFY